MKSCAWHACLCGILMFVASPVALASIHRVPSGGGDDYGAGYGGYDQSGGTSCSADAPANGSDPSSGAVYWASINTYTDQAGYFYVSWDCSSDASATYTDQNGSGASGSGGGSASTYGGSASSSVSLSSGGQVKSESGSDPDGGSSGMTEWPEWFDAYGGVSASSSCGAYASIGNSPNTGHGHGNAYADVWLSN